MKTTDALLCLPDGMYFSDDGREMLESFSLHFNLSREDWEIFKEIIMPKLPDCDFADGLLAMLTFGIHKSYEELTGKVFVLDMDRDKNQTETCS